MRTSYRLHGLSCSTEVSPCLCQCSVAGGSHAAFTVHHKHFSRASVAHHVVLTQDHARPDLISRLLRMEGAPSRKNYRARYRASRPWTCAIESPSGASFLPSENRYSMVQSYLCTCGSCPTFDIGTNEVWSKYIQSHRRSGNNSVMPLG